MLSAECNALQSPVWLIACFETDVAAWAVSNQIISKLPPRSRQRCEVLTLSHPNNLRFKPMYQGSA